MKSWAPLQELTVAQNVARDNSLRDFILPLLIDDLPHREINIQLARLNSISFRSGWALGVKTLLEKLDQEGLPKSPNFTPGAVATWWRKNFSADEGVSNQPQEYLSNLAEIDPIRVPLPYLKGFEEQDIGSKQKISIKNPYNVWEARF